MRLLAFRLATPSGPGVAAALSTLVGIAALLCLSAICASAAGAPRSYGQSEEPSVTALERGRQLYGAFRCAECHGASGEGDFGPALVGTDATFEIFLRQTRGNVGWYMPAYSEEEISDARLGEMWAWLKSLEEPGAPGSRSGQTTPEPAHFHHVHLNVTDPAATIAFYEKFFGANRVRYRDLSDALFTEKSFILLSRVSEPPPSNLGSTLWHIGWAGVDGQSEFDWRTAEGIGVQTPITPLGQNFYMYFWGPDREVIEVYTGSRNHRFEHVHLLATDVDATIRWFVDNLGLAPRGPTRPYRSAGVFINTIRVDNVNLIVFGKPAADVPRPAWLPEEVGDDFTPTEGSAIDHVGFSVQDLRPVYNRIVANGVEIVRPVATSEEYGLTSFFVAGPDGLLVEIVEEKPVPEGIWRR